MPKENTNSILVICAHPDDETLGAGGTIAAHTEEGVPVDVMCLTSNDIRKSELEAACADLGVREIYVGRRDDFAIDMSLRTEVVDAILHSRPKIIITHSKEDYNQNHVLCSELVSQAAEWASHTTLYDDAHKVDSIYHMEINSLLSRPQVLVDISLSYQRALKALNNHQSQIDKAEGFYLKFYDARTRLRGVQASCARAEAFTIEIPFHAGPFYPENSVKRLI